MSENETNSSVVNMQIDSYALGANSSNVINNNFSPPRKNLENREDYDETPLPEFPNQIKEALSTIKKYLSRQESRNEIKITKEEIKINERVINLEYEPCRLCKNEPAQLTCPRCQRKVCPKCVTKRSKETQCLRCKNAKKTKDRLNSEFEEKIEKLLNLENKDKIKEIVLVEVEKLERKSLEELITIVKKLEIKRDRLDRAISIAYFYVGRIFYEKMEEFFSEEDLVGEQKVRKILSSFRHARDLDFGEEKMTIREVKEKLGIDDNKISRFFSLTLKIYLIYKNFSGSEEQIRKAESVPAITWLRDLSQEKFLDFLGKLEQEKGEKK